MGTIYKLDDTGHGMATWTKEEGQETAKKLFDELRTKGWAATQTFPGTDKNAKLMHSFDPTVEDIVMIPNVAGG